MFTFSSSDAVAVLRQAPNVNAAVKKFLKREVRKGDALERLVKDLRDLLLAKDPARAIAFLDRERPQGDAVAVALGGYLFPELVGDIATPIVEKHAETFNQSYTSDGEAISVTNRKLFDAVVNEVQGAIAKGLAGGGFPDSEYLRQVVLSTIFDRPVLREILAPR